ncbi:hypothetical protein BO85DRAFT_489922 [Aspergillus piperis CBS 112811]|uniref:C2H2-type domain-containing protein n=1 Tax=Aspergillus piperis CBS 112811 TaxID=1448313 RepID=A0A8G1QWY5_9EURO|nr:hypothetical protein BO85DRAFT_489922 [Aspergillus piperis CBS 112811]RAH55931.1 hypothetical protein BO85DRAFT_489922 [Aspergillus piperis CBS 112811]
MATGLNRERRRRRKTAQEERICPICSQSFKKAEHLARHFRTHTKERPFICVNCGKFFARQDTLLRHSRSHHRNTNDCSNVLASNASCQDDPSQQNVHIAPLTSSEHTISMAEQEPPHPQCPLLTNEPDLTITTSPTHSPENLPIDATFDTDFFPDGGGDIFQPQTTGPALWNCLWETDWISWLEGSDFTIGDFNLTLPIIGSTEQLDTPMTTNMSASDSIQRGWHTFSEATISSREDTPDSTTSSSGLAGDIQTHADDAYRKKLAETLQQRVQQPDSLPSATFLDLCIRAYFTHFHPIFPLIHAATFQPSKQNAVLLLSICSIGSLCLGSARAVARGISMFECLNKAMLASWDTYISARGSLRIFGLQAALIGQTFGLLVGRPKDLTGSETFHGCLIAWARKAGLFKLQGENDIAAEIREIADDSPALNTAWKAWSRSEEKRRVILAIHIHDAELTNLHHHEPILRHTSESLPCVSPPELFTAPNARTWKCLLLNSTAPPRDTATPSHTTEAVTRLPLNRLAANDFLSYGLLEGIGTWIHEHRAPVSVHQCESLLATWYRQFKQSCDPTKPDPFCQMILWHAVSMRLYARFDELECALGREGLRAAQEASGYAAAWAGSLDAKRCLLHAVLLQRQFQAMNIGVEPAIHVPMALYYCGIAWASFTRFGTGDGVSNLGVNFPEFRILGLDQGQLFREAMRGVQWGMTASGPFSMIISLLGKIGHWKVAERFAGTLLRLQDVL